MVSCSRWWGLLAWVAVVTSTASGCASDEPKKETSYNLPETTTELDGSGGFPVPDSSGGEDAAGLPDQVGEDAGAGDELTGSDGAISDLEEASGGSDAADVGPETTEPITSCEGHCGIYLEDNPCHCSVLCQSEGSCCDDFAAVCTCGTDKDCDDSNDCTLDSCNKAQGICFQQPMKSCCMADSECSGGDVCNTPKCLSGTCTLQPMSCDDGITCTDDFCSKTDGKCVNKTKATQCVIDGACFKAGDEQPDSGGCSTCDPAKSQTQWTAKAGKCSIEGACVASGTAKDGAVCAVCDTTKSTSAWSVKVGNCLIADACHKSGEVNPASSCEVCDPLANPTGWSGKAGFCAIDGACVAANAVDPTNPCQICDPTKNKSGWTAAAGKCLIDGTCYSTGQADPTNACQTCDPAKNKAGWTAASGKCLIDGKCVSSGASQPGSGGCFTCDTKTPTQWTQKAAGTACSLGGCFTLPKCDAAGVCSGTQKPGCCVTNADCDSDPAVPGVCEEKACNTVTGKCELKPVTGCCTAGICCDIPTNTLKEKGAACGGLKSGAEYKCEGSLVMKRDVFSGGCTGTEPSKCAGSITSYGEWVQYKDCKDQTCTPGSSVTVAPICK